jgi:hypothetical protein
VTRFQADPKESHVLAVKRIFRYLKGTKEFGLWYPKGKDLSLIAYTDADWAGCIDDQKGTSGSTIYLGECLVSCLSKNNHQYLYLQSRKSILQQHHVVHRYFG